MLRGYYRTFYVHTFLTLSFTRSQCACLDGMFCILSGSEMRRQTFGSGCDFVADFHNGPQFPHL